jgi:hypothetical protein
MRDEILHNYQHRVGQPVEHLEVFEALACARRLITVAVSLNQGPERMGMNPQAIEAMQAMMPAHRKVYQLFVDRTGIQITAFERLFGKTLNVER